MHLVGFGIGVASLRRVRRQAGLAAWHGHAVPTRAAGRRSALALTGVAALALLVAPLGPPALAAGARQPAPLAATLAAPGGTVSVVDGESGAAHMGADGETLRVGDRIITGADGSALVTFSDGSEVSLEPGTELRLSALSQTAGGGTLTVLEQSAGVTVSRVTALATDSTYEMDVPSATALVRGTEFETEVMRQPGTGQLMAIGITARSGVVEVRSATEIRRITNGQEVEIHQPGF